MHSLTASGHGYGAMARELGVDRRAVRKYARAGLFRHRAPRRPGAVVEASWFATNSTAATDFAAAARWSPLPGIFASALLS